MRKHGPDLLRAAWTLLGSNLLGKLHPEPPEVVQAPPVVIVRDVSVVVGPLPGFRDPDLGGRDDPAQGVHVVNQRGVGVCGGLLPAGRRDEPYYLPVEVRMRFLAEELHVVKRVLRDPGECPMISSRANEQRVRPTYRFDQVPHVVPVLP